MTTKQTPTKQTTVKKPLRAQATSKPKAAKVPTPAPLVPGPGEIVVSNGKGPMLVKADTVHDFFAIHAPIDGGPKGHVLTHIATGRRVATYRTRLLATWVAAQLRACGGAELWSFTDPNHLAKHAKKDVLAQLRRLADPVTAEQTMREGQDPGGARIAAGAAKVRKALDAIEAGGGVKLTPTSTRHSADPVEPPKYSSPWREGIDWVAAGKKAYETRLRNLAARQAEAAAAVAPAPVKRGARS